MYICVKKYRHICTCRITDVTRCDRLPFVKNILRPNLGPSSPSSRAATRPTKPSPEISYFLCQQPVFSGPTYPACQTRRGPAPRASTCTTTNPAAYQVRLPVWRPSSQRFTLHERLRQTHFLRQASSTASGWIGTPPHGRNLHRDPPLPLSPLPPCSTLGR